MSTVKNLSVRLSRRIADTASSGDSDGKRFTADQRLEALQTAVDRTVTTVLALSTPKKTVYQLLSSITSTKNVTVNSDGIDLTDIHTNILPTGVIAVELEIDGRRVWGNERDIDEVEFADNEWERGSDESPRFYVEGNKLYVEVTIGSYPVDTEVHYVRRHDELIYAGTGNNKTTQLELNPILTEAVLSAASALCYQFAGEADKLQLSESQFTKHIQSLVKYEVVTDDS